MLLWNFFFTTSHFNDVSAKTNILIISDICHFKIPQNLLISLQRKDPLINTYIPAGLPFRIKRALYRTTEIILQFDNMVACVFDEDTRHRHGSPPLTWLDTKESSSLWLRGHPPAVMLADIIDLLYLMVKTSVRVVTGVSVSGAGECISGWEGLRDGGATPEAGCRDMVAWPTL